jgi:fumarylacetoacetase
VPQSAVEYRPADIGDFTDFYASIHHATAVGRLFRPDNPLLPNYKWVPIAYHGRASSVRVSGFEVHRPLGQLMPPGAVQPTLGPSRRLDYEVELGVYVGRGNELGSRVPLPEAEAHVFGLCLLNDWSARDIQAWEYQPLGPFLAKNFATTVSPWVVTLEARPFAPRGCVRRRSRRRLPTSTLPPRACGALDIQLEAWIDSARARPPTCRRCGSRSVVPRLVVDAGADAGAPHGRRLQPVRGDLIGTGTQSGATPEEAGSLLELTAGGQRALQLPGGESRTFLEDGDRVTLRGWCERPGYRRIGFGEARGTVLPSSAA